MPVTVEIVKETPINGSKPAVGDLGEFSIDAISRERSRPPKKILDKYYVGRNGVLFTDTPEGRFSPIDLEYGRIVLMTRALVNKRAEFRN